MNPNSKVLDKGNDFLRGVPRSNTYYSIVFFLLLNKDELPCFGFRRVGFVILKQEKYSHTKAIDDNLVFMHDNDSKCTPEISRNYLKLLVWPPQRLEITHNKLLLY